MDASVIEQAGVYATIFFVESYAMYKLSVRSAKKDIKKFVYDLVANDDKLKHYLKRALIDVLNDPDVVQLGEAIARKFGNVVMDEIKARAPEVINDISERYPIIKALTKLIQPNQQHLNNSNDFKLLDSHVGRVKPKHD